MEKVMTQKEQLKTLFSLAKEEKRLVIVVEMYEPTKERKLSVYHNRDLDKTYEEIDGLYNKTLRLRSDYDHMISSVYITEDEDLRFLLNGEEPYVE